MPRRKALPISGSVLAWAIQEAGLSLQEAAERTGLPAAEIESWIRDQAKPSIGQVRKLAEVVHRPMAVFYLPRPPEDVAVPSALRRTAGAMERDLTPEQLRQARRGRQIQRLVRSLLTTDAAAAPQLPELSQQQDSLDAGGLLRHWIGVPVRTQLEWTTPKQAFDEWRLALEERRVLVLQLQLGEFLRWFSLWDELAPLVAVNTADNYQARSFTLFHELSHLASRTESSCANRVGASSTSPNIERWCEEVASASLLPRDALRQLAEERREGVGSEFALVSQIARYLYHDCRK